MRTVGIIGGLGPQTTAVFYMLLMERFCIAKPDLKPSIHIHNVPVPSALEDSILLDGNNLVNIVPLLQESAISLEQAGCDFLVIPCNTVHQFLPSVQSSVHIPILSIIDLTVQRLVDHKLCRVLVLGSASTKKTGLYAHALADANIEGVFPNLTLQKELDVLIHELVRGKTPTNITHLKEKIVFEARQSQTDRILLACTDLQLVLKNIDFPTIDSLEILAQGTIQKSLEPIL